MESTTSRFLSIIGWIWHFWGPCPCFWRALRQRSSSCLRIGTVWRWTVWHSNPGPVSWRLFWCETSRYNWPVWKPTYPGARGLWSHPSSSLRRIQPTTSGTCHGRTSSRRYGYAPSNKRNYGFTAGCSGKQTKGAGTGRQFSKQTDRISFYYRYFSRGKGK